LDLIVIVVPVDLPWSSKVLIYTNCEGDAVDLINSDGDDSDEDVYGDTPLTLRES
jgi:hypothetical protein